MLVSYVHVTLIPFVHICFVLSINDCKFSLVLIRPFHSTLVLVELYVFMVLYYKQWFLLKFRG